VLHERQPLYVLMSDGSIQNKYEFKVLNKTDRDFQVKVVAEGGIPGQAIVGLDGNPSVRHGRSNSFTVFVRAPSAGIKSDVTPITFRITNVDDANVSVSYTSQFYAPKR
jgi:polyferredoxin